MNKIAGMTVLAGGVILSSYTIKYSIASAVVTVMGMSCNMETTENFDSSTMINETFQSSCANELLITDITVDCGNNSEQAGSCMVNGVVAANGACTLPTCVANP